MTQWGLAGGIAYTYYGATSPRHACPLPLNDWDCCAGEGRLSLDLRASSNAHGGEELRSTFCLLADTFQRCPQCMGMLGGHFIWGFSHAWNFKPFSFVTRPMLYWHMVFSLLILLYYVS